jgi:Holliday junction resolvasome RuvABC endonuclease subunit
MVKLNSIIGKPTKILAIDASTNSLAFSVFNSKDLVSFGKIKYSGITTYDKVVDACRKTKAFFDAYEPFDAIVIEHTVFMNSPKTAADLALVQGALLGAAGLTGVSIIKSVAPITWQNYIGNKKLSKEEKLAIRKQYPEKSDSWLKTYERNLRKEKTINYINIQYDRSVSDPDVADAIGIGHYAVNNWDRLTN